MVSSNRQFSIAGIALLAGIMVLSGCATHKYVKQEIGKLQPQIQEATNAGKENAERIDAVDKRATAGITAAQQAADRANGAAQQAAQAAQAADRKADGANTGVQAANTRINTLETRVNNINLSDNYTPGETQTVTFKVNSSALSDMAKQTLDSMASNATGQRQGYMLELQGFTDGTGSESYNETLSQRRAESVQRYLVSKGVPLFRISIVGLGKLNPIGDNKTKAGRDQNRRVEVRMLKAVAGSTTN